MCVRCVRDVFSIAQQFTFGHRHLINTFNPFNGWKQLIAQVYCCVLASGKKKKLCLNFIYLKETKVDYCSVQLIVGIYQQNTIPITRFVKTNSSSWNDVFIHLFIYLSFVFCNLEIFRNQGENTWERQKSKKDKNTAKHLNAIPHNRMSIFCRCPFIGSLFWTNWSRLPKKKK